MSTPGRYLAPLLLVIAMGCSSKSAPTKTADDTDTAPVTDNKTEAFDASPGWHPIDLTTLDDTWRALLDRCLQEKRKDGYDIDHYELVETKAVDAVRYMYFTPKRTPDGPITSDHFGCRFDADDEVHILYEG